jgi:putative heme-binding domain-containing protein
MLVPHFRWLAVSALLLTAPVLLYADPPVVASSPHLTPEQEKAKFHLPPGFEAQLVASEPDIRKPMNIAFDARGRLWVTDSEEYPFPAPPDRKAKDTVKILEDFGPDGRARKITTFADGLNIPIGLFPLKNGCIVYSIPNIWKLTDTSGAGKADKRELLYGSIGVRDTHGMTNSFTLGFDGWLYACHGYLNSSELKGSDGQVLKMNSGNVYRMKLDGSHCEIYTHGQVNPFGLCFDPLGNLYSGDCHSMPLTQLMRGAWYDSFGKPNDGLGYAPHMCDFKEHSTALCGVVFYAADHFPDKYRGMMFLGDVVENRLNAYKIDYAGSSPKAKREDFLTSDDPWFRPAYSILGPDGALYVTDFYNRIIGHYEAPLNHPGRDRTSGRIWRIVYKGTDGKAPKPLAPIFDYTKASSPDLVRTLKHPNLAASMMAMHELVDRGESALPAMLEIKRNGDQTERMFALWILERQHALDDEMLRVCLEHGNVGAKTHAMRILAERAKISPEQANLVERFLEEKNPALKPWYDRLAAEVMSQHPSSEFIRPLLNLRQHIQPGDDNLLYQVRLALRNHMRDTDFLAKPADLSDKEREVILDVLPAVPTANGAAFMLDSLNRLPNTGPRPPEWIKYIARYGALKTCLEVVGFAQSDKDLQRQVAVFQAFRQGFQERGSALPESAQQWGAKLTSELLTASDDRTLLAGAQLAGSLKLKAAEQTLLHLAAEKQRGDAVRSAALTALAAIDGPRHASLLGKTLTDMSESRTLREQTARVLGTIPQKEGRAQLVAALQTAPAETASLLAEGLAGTREGAEELLALIDGGKASPRLLQERPIQVRLEQLRLPKWPERFAKLTAGLPPADQRMDQLLKTRAEGFRKAKLDAALGAKVFEKNCANCHQLAGKGAKIGPQLDGVGNRPVERLLEDILDPNRNVDPNFRTTRLTLKDGRDVLGLLLREEGEVVVLADNQGKEVRIEKKAIEERATSPLSPMPANWSEAMSETELNHLLAYLLQQRGK